MSDTVKVPFIKTNDKAEAPERATAGAAGYDLRACMDEPLVLESRQRALIPTGIAAALPEGYVGLVFGRSGLGIKHGVTMANGVGVIDSDYRGEFHVPLVNHSETPYTIGAGDRIAQLLVIKAESAVFEEVDALDETSRGTGGFGSTGK